MVVVDGRRAGVPLYVHVPADLEAELRDLEARDPELINRTLCSLIARRRILRELKKEEDQAAQLDTDTQRMAQEVTMGPPKGKVL